MKKENWYKVLFTAASLLIVTYVISMIYDWKNYDSVVTSAPFSVNIIVRSLEFMLPCVVSLVCGAICKKKFNRFKTHS